MYLDEDVEAVNYGIPIRCVEGELTIVGRHEISLDEAARRAPFPVLVPTRLPATSRLEVLYEERRRFFPFATVDLVYHCRGGLLVSCQTERFRGEVPAVGWERVDAAVGDETFVSWVMERPRGSGFGIWPPMQDSVRIAGATYEDFVLCMETNFLDRDDLVEVIVSVEEVGRQDGGERSHHGLYIIGVGHLNDSLCVGSHPRGDVLRMYGQPPGRGPLAREPS